MTITNLLILGLAIWRIASLFVNETGPGKIFLKLRKGVGLVHDEQGQVYQIPDTFFAGIFSCTWCLSPWIAFFWTIFLIISPKYSIICAFPFALSALAIMIEMGIQKLKE